MDAGFQGVHGGGGLADDRGRACGFLGVAAVRFDLADGGHMDKSYFEDRRAISGFRG